MALNDLIKTTVYLVPDLHRALKIKVGLSSQTMSAFINDAIKDALGEDSQDLAAITQARHEKSYPLDEVLKSLKLEHLA